MDSILFDLDGTLWDSVEGVVYSWNKKIKEYPQFKVQVTPAFLRSVMGMQMQEISKKLFEGYDEEEALEVFKVCCRYECEYLAEVGGTLYPALEASLEMLSRQYKLAIISNCQAGYIEAFLKAHRLERYFVDIQDAESTGKSKGENIRLLMARNGMQSAVYVGDTAGDQKAAAEAGVPFVYARYGFGEVDTYDEIIDCFEELITLYGK